MKTSITVLAMMLLLFSSLPIRAAEGEGGMSGAYLRLSPDPRSSAMGGAFTAVAEGAAASLWNPAALGYLKGFEVGTSISHLSMGRNLGYIIGNAKLPGNAGLGGGWLRAWVNDLPLYDNGGSQVGIYNFSQNAFFVSFGRQIFRPIAAGVTVKVFYHFLDNVGATGTSVDAGVLVKPSNFLSLGLVFQDIKGTESWESANIYSNGKKEKIPLTIRGGASWAFLERRLLLVGELSGQMHHKPAYHLGIECWVNQELALRAGYDNGELAAGGGLLYPMGKLVLTVDYAYTQDPMGVSAGHRFSFGFSF
jgi:hypothetical protein